MERLNKITSKVEETFNASVDYAYAHPKAGLVVVIVWLTLRHGFYYPPFNRDMTEEYEMLMP